MKKMIENHKARLSQKMNPFDMVNFNHYMGLNFFFALRKGITFKQAFTTLQEGLRRTMQLIPALEGKSWFVRNKKLVIRRATSASQFPLFHLRPPGTAILRTLLQAEAAGL